MIHPFKGLGFLGLCAGIVWESTEHLLRLWGKEAGFSLTQLGWLSVMHMVYSLKFFWGPFLSLGMTRQQWLLLLLGLTGLLLVFLGFFSFFSIPFLVILFFLMVINASLDMLVVASQRDASPPEYWGISETVCITGYRVGMMAVGSSALMLSARGWSWGTLYMLAGLSVMVGTGILWKTKLLSFVKDLPFQKMSLKERFLLPLTQWFQEKPWIWIVMTIFFYRAQDGLVDPLRDLFLLSLGISKGMLIWTHKIGGLLASVFGGVLAGFIIRFLGFYRMLFLGLLAHVLSIGLLLAAAEWKRDLIPLIFLEMMLKGFSLIGFFSFQLTCCQSQHVVTQLAFLTSLSGLGMYCFGACSGFLIDQWGWSIFLLCALFMNVPALICISQLGKKKSA